MKAITKLLITMLFLCGLSLAQGSFTLYYSDTFTPNSDGSATVTPTVSISGNDGGWCDPANGCTGYEYPAVMVNGNAWQIDLANQSCGGSGCNLAFAATFPNVSVPLNGKVDLSYAGKVQGVYSFSSQNFTASTYQFYTSTFQDGFNPNYSPGPCFLGTQTPTCPSLWPRIFLTLPATWHAVDMASSWITNYIAIPNEWISTSAAVVSGCQEDEFGIWYGCTYSGTKPWCTPATYPPYFNVSVVLNMDYYLNDPTKPWATLDMIKGCFRSSGSGPWTCSSPYVYQKIYPTGPLGACTSAAAMQ